MITLKSKNRGGIWAGLVGLVWVGCFLASVARAEEGGPNPAEVFIRGATYGGEGCPQGTASSVLSPDAQQISVIFDQYSVEAGGGSVLDSGKSCIVNLQLNVPPNWSYTIFSVDYRGYADLDAGTFATLQSGYFFGTDNTVRMATFDEQTLKGAYSDDFLFRNLIPLDRAMWSPCGEGSKELRVRTKIRAVGGPNARASITVDSLDGSLENHYAIRWRKCGEPNDTVLLHRYLSADQSHQPVHPKSGGGLENSYRPMGPAYKVFAVNAPGRTPLYQCSRVRNGGVIARNQPPIRYESILPNCDDGSRVAKNEGVLGYVLAAPARGNMTGMMPLRRYWKNSPNGVNGRLYLMTSTPSAGAPGGGGIPGRVPGMQEELIGYVPVGVTSGPHVGPAPGRLECASVNNGRSTCPSPTPIGSARLLEQKSNSPCRQGVSWGFDARSIWVSGGCRAVFEVTAP
ncbi:MAG: DUF4360 domain-containing protein, partial [Bacteriovoracia bacterium]